LEFKFNKELKGKLRRNVILSSQGMRLMSFAKDGTFVSDIIKVPIDVAEPFLAIGSSWDIDGKGDGVYIEIRASSDSVSWGKWQRIYIDEHLTSEDGKFYGMLIFLGKNTSYIQYRITLRDSSRGVFYLRSLRLRFISPGVTPGKIRREIDDKPGTNLDIKVQKPPIVSRTEWGCPDGQYSPRWPPRYTTVTHLIVHHTATPNSADDWAAVVRAIWDFHANFRGWGDIGYNYLIDPNGVIYEGRAGGDNVIGAHFSCANSNTMGVGMLGNFMNISPTSKALFSLEWLLAWKCYISGIDPLGITYHPSTQLNLYNISGHRDANPTKSPTACPSGTVCPGDVLYSKLPSIRSDILAFLSSEPPRVLSTKPDSGFTNFLAYKSVIIRFSIPMDINSVNRAISITPGASVSIKWSSDSKVLEIKPEPFWSFSTTYTIKIDTGAKSIFGVPIDGNGDGIAGDPFILKFTTTPVDTFPPVVEKWFPTGEDVSIYAEMKFVFNEVIDGLGGRVKFVDEYDNTVPIRTIGTGHIIKDDKSIILFKPQYPLEPDKIYKVIFKAGIYDKFGNATDVDYVFQFRTRPGVFRSGIVIDSFEVQGMWWKPIQSGSTTGVDSSKTDFTISSEKKMGGSYSGKLTYKFINDSGGIVRLYNSGNFRIFDKSKDIGLWIYGDLSGNGIQFWFYNPDNFIADLGQINWFGWKFISYPVESIPSDNFLSFHSIVIRQIEGADIEGVIYFDDLQFGGRITSVEQISEIMPDNFVLYQNYPNPFNSSTVIEFDLPVRVDVKLVVYDILGREVERILDGEMEAGRYKIIFDSSNLSSGIYFYRLSAGSFIDLKKMVLVR
jgi:hypothetical protein